MRLPLSMCLRFLGCLLFITATLAQEKSTTNPLNEPLGNPGVIPAGPDGKPLNLNFETGNLQHWSGSLGAQ